MATGTVYLRLKLLQFLLSFILDDLVLLPVLKAAGRRAMASMYNSLALKHGLSMRCPRSASLNRSPSIGFRVSRRSFVVASSTFANENRE